MRKLVMYKPYKKIGFNDDSNDLSSVSGEFTAVARTFAERGWDVVIASPTDLKDGEINNIRNGNVLEDADRTMVFCGSFAKDYYGDSVIPMLKKQTQQLDFVLTDYKLVPTNIKYLDYFDNIYCQATRPLFGKQTKYCGSTFILYGHRTMNADDLNDIELIIKDKTIDYSFGGTERNRLDDYLEYVWRPDCKLMGKSDTLGFDNRVPATEYRKILDATKFSIVIADVNYNTDGFVTQRHWENLKHNIISFMDSKCDPDEAIMKKDDWRRVKNYKELKMKMGALLKDIELYKKKLAEGIREIKEEYLNGDEIYEKLEGD